MSIHNPNCWIDIRHVNPYQNLSDLTYLSTIQTSVHTSDILVHNTNFWNDIRYLDPLPKPSD
jgi:hypothetical protein